FQTAGDLVFALENIVDMSSGSTAVVSSAPGARAMWLVAAAVGAIVAVSFGAWRVTSRRTPPARASRAVAASDAPQRLLAVLPFETITGGGTPGYFSAGMTDEITGQLSKVSALRPGDLVGSIRPRSRRRVRRPVRDCAPRRRRPPGERHARRSSASRHAA